MSEADDDEEELCGACDEADEVEHEFHEQFNEETTETQTVDIFSVDAVDTMEPPHVSSVDPVYQTIPNTEPQMRAMADKNEAQRESDRAILNGSNLTGYQSPDC